MRAVNGGCVFGDREGGVRGLSSGRHESHGSQSDACRAFKRNWAMMIFGSCR